MNLWNKTDLCLGTRETFDLANILDDVFCAGGFESLPEEHQDFLQNIIALIKGR